MMEFNKLLNKAINEELGVGNMSSLYKYIETLRDQQTAATYLLRDLGRVIATKGRGMLHVRPANDRIYIAYIHRRSYTAAGEKFDPASDPSKEWVVRLNGQEWEIRRPRIKTPTIIQIDMDLADVAEQIVGAMGAKYSRLGK